MGEELPLEEGELPLEQSPTDERSGERQRGREAERRRGAEKEREREREKRILSQKGLPHWLQRSTRGRERSRATKRSGAAERRELERRAS